MVMETPVVSPVNWMKEKHLWFSSDMKPAQLLQNKRDILKYQQRVLSKHFEELKNNIQKFRTRVGRCPLSGRSEAFQTEIEKILEQHGGKRENDLRGIFNLMNEDMKNFISLISSAENLQDRQFVMSILDGDLDGLTNVSKEKKWLSSFIDNDGLVPLAKWVEGDVDDGLLNKILDVMLQASMEGKSASLLSRSKFFVNLNIPKEKADLRKKKNTLKSKWRNELPELANAKKEEATEVKKEKEKPKEAIKTEVKSSGVKLEKPSSPKVTNVSQPKKNDEDLFKGMFGSKNRKPAAPVPAPSTMRMTLSERTAVMDDELVISDARGPSSSSSSSEKSRGKENEAAAPKEEEKDKDGLARKRANDPLPLPVLDGAKAAVDEEPQKKKRRVRAECELSSSVTLLCRFLGLQTTNSVKCRCERRRRRTRSRTRRSLTDLGRYVPDPEEWANHRVHKDHRSVVDGRKHEMEDERGERWEVGDERGGFIDVSRQKTS
eukprot:745688-Hanusia_phi.AAC.1